MEESINWRIKQVREALELNQRKFAQIISVSQGYFASVENGTRKINPRLIKLIVSEFGVNETWLLTGEGEMFSQNPDEKFAKLVGLFKGLSSKNQELIYQIIGVLLKMEETERE
jgi:transcriptional regulator with XRE-family HTH domain